MPQHTSERLSDGTLRVYPTYIAGFPLRVKPAANAGVHARNLLIATTSERSGHYNPSHLRVAMRHSC